MSTRIYQINKGINKPIEFKGFRAQYIGYLGAGFVSLLVLFAVLYICGANPFICLGLILTSGAFWVFFISRLSHKYGPHGLMKKWARKRVPPVLKNYSRRVFTGPLR